MVHKYGLNSLNYCFAQLIGSIDPWHVLSILRNQTNGEVAVYMKGTAHCANMNPIQPDSPLSLKNGKQVSC